MVSRSTGSWTFAVDGAGDHLGLADGELVALPAHLLDEDGERELAAALDLPGVRALGGQDPHGDVADQLAVEALLDQARGDLGATDPAGHRRGVRADGHRDRRLVDGDEGQRAGVGRVGEGLADGDLGDAGHGDDVAGPGLLGGDPLEGLGPEQLGDLDRLHRPVAAAPGHLLALAQRPVLDAEQGQAAEEVRGVEVGDVRLERRLRVVRRRRDGLEDGAEQRLEVGAVGQPAVGGAVRGGAAGLRGGVDDREVELVLVVRDVLEQVHEELVDLVDDLADAGVGTVDLVDAQHDGQARRERLAQHEAGLRQRPLAGVDEQHDAVDHRQPALDLAAEVGVARGVDDVDRDATGEPGVGGGLAGVPDGGVLREDGDALLALQVPAVHGPLGHVVVLPEGAGLPEHLVDEGGLAVVDVRDDGDVAEVVAAGGGHTLQSLRIHRADRIGAGSPSQGAGNAAVGDDPAPLGSQLGNHWCPAGPSGANAVMVPAYPADGALPGVVSGPMRPPDRATREIAHQRGTNMTLKRKAPVVLATIAALGLTACAQSERDDNGSGDAGSSEFEDTFTFGAAGAPDVFDPFYATDGETFRITRQIHQGLLGVKPGTADMQPELAGELGALGRRAVLDLQAPRGGDLLRRRAVQRRGRLLQHAAHVRAGGRRSAGRRVLDVLLRHASATTRRTRSTTPARSRTRTPRSSTSPASPRASPPSCPWTRSRCSRRRRSRRAMPTTSRPRATASPTPSTR